MGDLKRFRYSDLGRLTRNDVQVDVHVDPVVRQEAPKDDHMDVPVDSHVDAPLDAQMDAQVDVHSRKVARKSDRLTLRLDPEILFLLDQLCEETCRTRTKMVEVLIRQASTRSGVQMDSQVDVHMDASPARSDIDDDERNQLIVKEYEQYTLNRWKPEDAIALGEHASVPTDALRAGIVYAIYKATPRVNSFRYCAKVGADIASNLKQESSISAYMRSLHHSYGRQREAFEQKQRRAGK